MVPRVWKPASSASRAHDRNRPRSVSWASVLGSPMPSFTLASLALKLLGRRHQLDDAPVAEHPHRHRTADPLRGHQPLEVAGALHGHPVDIEDEVLGTKPGQGRGTARHHFYDLHAVLPPNLPGH